MLQIYLELNWNMIECIFDVKEGSQQEDIKGILYRNAVFIHFMTEGKGGKNFKKSITRNSAPPYSWSLNVTLKATT